MTAVMTPKETTMSQADLGALIAPVCAIARKAGDEILEIYGTDFAVRVKADASPVTDADEAAERIIVDGSEEVRTQSKRGGPCAAAPAP